MKTVLRLVRRAAPCLGLCLFLLLTACATQKTAARSPKGQLLENAGNYASKLKSENKLPGYSSSEHGRMIASAPWKGGKVAYPALVNVRAWKEGDDTTYCYSLLKDAPESSWQLTKATHLGKHDLVIEQLFPK